MCVCMCFGMRSLRVKMPTCYETDFSSKEVEFGWWVVIVVVVGVVVGGGGGAVIVKPLLLLIRGIFFLFRGFDGDVCANVC